jgi:thiamine pyrophosphate-dependent acetolactate synthase large subunit-like protein
MRTVADQFAETLAAVGVKRIYGIVGDSLNGRSAARQKSTGFLDFGTEFKNPNVAAMAEAADPAGAKDGIAAALAHDGPVLVDAVVNRAELAMPTGTPSVLLAQQYNTCEAETANIMLVTTLGMLVALPAGVAVSAYL